MAGPLLAFDELLELTGANASPVPFAIVPVGAVLAQARDTTRRYGLDLVDPTTGASLAGRWSDASPPAVRALVWAGDSSAVATTPALVWASAAAAQLYLDVSPATLAGLAAQPYPLRVEVQTGAGWLVAWSGTLRPEDAPGTAPARPVYTDYAELEAIAGDALDQLRGRSEGAGLLRSRGEAREWLDGVILDHYRPVGFGSFGECFSTTLGTFVTVDGPNPTIAGYLAANYLMVTPKVQRIAAWKALGFAFGRQLGSEECQRYSGHFHACADAEVQTLRAQLDLNADGYAEITIDCGLISRRSI